MNCLFCNIIKKEIGAEIVYEDGETMVFLDTHPRAPGHVMVVPKFHAENIADLPNEEVGPVFLTVKKITGILSRTFLPRENVQGGQRPDGFTIGINQGKASGQVIDHLHTHIIPRFNDDGGKSIHSVVNNPPKESLMEIAERIKKAN